MDWLKNKSGDVEIKNIKIKVYIFKMLNLDEVF